MSRKRYSELIQIPSFEERFEYLKLDGRVGENTFGSKRYLNQLLYKTSMWKQLRDKVIIRDSGCDLGILDREIAGRAIVHHITPITVEDILNENPIVFDMDNLITMSHLTHEAVHYGDDRLLIKEPIERHEFDTCPWKHKEAIM